MSYSVPKQDGNVDVAYEFVLTLKAGGLTNINDALLEAIQLASDVKRNEELETGTQQMIVFLTDGDATAGEIEGNKIRANIRQANRQFRIPIYGLAFGEDADFNLLKSISSENKGFAQKIYESGNSFEQLEDFYNKISGEHSPLVYTHFRFFLREREETMWFCILEIYLFPPSQMKS